MSPLYITNCLLWIAFSTLCILMGLPTWALVIHLLCIAAQAWCLAGHVRQHTR